MLQHIAPSIRIMEICGDLPSAVKKSITKNKPDIVFLDIELPVYSGIQLLDFFNPEEITFHIIFTTAYNNYALRAFEMSAVDYLMKPIHEEKLRLALEKAGEKDFSSKEIFPVLKNNFQYESQKKMVVPVANGFEVLSLHTICYLKAEGSYTRIFFASNTNMLVSKNLKHFEYVLTGINYFIRIHRSFIVNINFAKKVLRSDGGTLLLENNTEIPIAEDNMQLILDSLQKL